MIYFVIMLIMKKIWFYIVWVISISLFFLYKIYLTPSISNQIISTTWTIHHTVEQKIYNEIEFITTNGEELKKVKELSSLWTMCEKKKNKSDIVICYQVTWYQHTYSVPSLHLRMIAYTTSYPRYNSWIFMKTDSKPFILSGNAVYETNNSYIHMYEYKEGENQKTRIEDKNNLDVLPIGNTWTRSYYSFRNMALNSWENTLLLYYFDSTKPYYYIISVPSSCDVWACWMNEHKINVFLD